VTLLEDAAAIAGELAELRHAIHREPELGYDLPRTQQQVLTVLDGLPLDITLGRRLTAVSR
jgi:metal-dependent amidase/aminoacylase/carboxypeptidase family protein